LKRLEDESHYLINKDNPRGFTDPGDLVEGGQLLYMRLPFPIATEKSQCKDGGWEWVFNEDGEGFKNITECNRYVGSNPRGHQLTPTIQFEDDSPVQVQGSGNGQN